MAGAIAKTESGSQCPKVTCGSYRIRQSRRSICALLLAGRELEVRRRPQECVMSIPKPISQRSRPTDDVGFTLLELLVVLGILALIATIATPQVMGYLGRARTETARAQISAISTALELYALDNAGYPQQSRGLNALVQPQSDLPTWRGPYLKKATGLVDPWGRSYIYRHPGRNTSAEVFSLGRDNAPGGQGEDQDLTNW